MPAAAVISSGVHERSIAVVKTFLVFIVEGAAQRGEAAAVQFCCVVVVSFSAHFQTRGRFGVLRTLSKLERFRQALFWRP